MTTNQNTPKIHIVKSVKPYFTDRQNGLKTFEIRNNDRNYQVGDILIERLWDEETQSYLGVYLTSKIEYITDFKQQGNYVVMSVRTLTNIDDLSAVLIKGMIVNDSNDTPKEEISTEDLLRRLKSPFYRKGFWDDLIIDRLQSQAEKIKRLEEELFEKSKSHTPAENERFMIEWRKAELDKALKKIKSYEDLIENVKDCLEEAAQKNIELSHEELMGTIVEALEELKDQS